MVHFVLEATERLDLRCFEVNWRGSGSEQYPPGMLLALLVYCYATGRFGSRRIEEATYSDVAVRYQQAHQMIEHLQMEVEALVQKAEDADSAPLDDGLSIPEEIARRQDRIAKLDKAKAIIEERFDEARKAKQADHEAKMKVREDQRRGGTPRPTWRASSLQDVKSGNCAPGRHQGESKRLPAAAPLPPDKNVARTGLPVQTRSHDAVVRAVLESRALEDAQNPAVM